MCLPPSIPLNHKKNKTIRNTHASKYGASVYMAIPASTLYVNCELYSQKMKNAVPRATVLLYDH